MCVCVHVCVAWYTYMHMIVYLFVCKSPSNQSFYRQIASYGMGVGDYEVA